MQVSIVNKKIFTYGEHGIIMFDINSNQESNDDIFLKPDIDKEIINTSSNMSFYFSNKNNHHKFKSKMVNTPVSLGAVEMFDYFGNNIGKYSKERKNNSTGGNISLVTEKVTLLSSVINRTKDCSVIYLQNYSPLENISSKGIINKCITHDLTQIKVDTSKVIVFLPEKLYKLFDEAGFGDIIKWIPVPDELNMINYSLEEIFGTVIRGGPSNISTFLKISGGKLDSVMGRPLNATISHRSDNRVQFISNSINSSSNIICILSDVKDNININYDDHLKPENFNGSFSESLDVSVTPSLPIDFHIKLFGLKELLKKLDVDDVKSVFIKNSAIVLQFMFDKFSYNLNLLNESEKMLVKLRSEIYHNLLTKFELCREQKYLPVIAPVYNPEHSIGIMTRQLTSCN